MVAERHDSKNGFVAVDNFEFIEDDKCLVNPPEADPNAPTTPQPTEPPGRKCFDLKKNINLYLKLFRISSYHRLIVEFEPHKNNNSSSY